MSNGIDYDALAKQAGAVSSVPSTSVSPDTQGAQPIDYNALAKQAGAISSVPPSSDVTEEPKGLIESFIGENHPRAQEWNRGLQLGVLDAFGLKAPDEKHPSSLGYVDAATQTINNLGKAAAQAWKGIDPTTPSGLAQVPGAAILTIPTMIAQGIEGMASTITEGGKELKEGYQANNHEAMARGAGKILGALGQISAGMERGVTSEEAAAASTARAAGKSGAAAIDTIRQTKTAAGAVPTPRSVAKRLINRSVGATVKDVRFGDPAEWLLNENIKQVSTGARLAATVQKLDPLVARLNEKLAQSTEKIDMNAVIEPARQNLQRKLVEGLITETELNNIVEDFGLIEEKTAQKNPSGILTPMEANEIKQAIGDAVNWEKRASPIHDLSVESYHDAYAAIKNAINEKVPGVAELNRRVSDGLSARNALREYQIQLKAGKGPMMGLATIGKTAELAGHQLTTLPGRAIVGTAEGTLEAAKAVPKRATAVSGFPPRKEEEVPESNVGAPAMGAPIPTGVTIEEPKESSKTGSPTPFSDIISAVAEKHGVDKDLITAVISQESNFDPKAVSNKGARGLMQLMPVRIRDLGITDPEDPEQNINGGVRYLKELLTRYNDNLSLALAAYSAGPDTVDQYKGIPPFKETQNYVKRVMKAFETLRKARMDSNAAVAAPGVEPERKGEGSKTTSPAAVAGPAGVPHPSTHDFSLAAWQKENPKGNVEAARKAAQAAGFDVVA